MAFLAIGICLAAPARASPQDDAALTAIAAADYDWRRLTPLEPAAVERARGRARREGDVLPLFQRGGL